MSPDTQLPPRPSRKLLANHRAYAERSGNGSTLARELAHVEAERDALRAINAQLSGSLADCAGFITSVNTDRKFRTKDGEVFCLQTEAWATGGKALIPAAVAAMEAADEHNENCRSNSAENSQQTAENERQSGWQPIETAPKDGTRVLLRREGMVALGEWRNLFGIDTWWRHGPLGGKPTHWHPIPPFAGEKGKQL